MKANTKTGLTVAAGIIIGAGFIQCIHAQTTPPVYYITEIDITNPEGFAKEYLPVMMPIIKADGVGLLPWEEAAKAAR